MLAHFGIRWALALTPVPDAPPPPPPPPVVVQRPAPAPLAVEKRAVASAFAEARERGYAPCEPAVVPFLSEGSQLPEVAGWAQWPEQGYPCRVSLRPGLSAAHRQEIARHEVCHLATARHIGFDDVSWSLVDPYHTHPAFPACLHTLAHPPA